MGERQNQHCSVDSVITSIDLLRHGEVKGGFYFRGKTDDPLTSKGWQQMQQATADQNWDIIISSPLSRCLDFAHWLSDQRKIPCNRVSGFSEIDFGDWEAKTAEQIERLNPGLLSRFYDDPEKFAPGNGESFSVFSKRVADAWQQTINENKGKNLLVITHAGVIRMIFSRILGISTKNSFHIQVDHACLSRFQHFWTNDYDYCQFLMHISGRW